jgi:ribosome biogenesis protein NSA1
VAPSFLASAAEDRYVRLHSTFPPPAQVGQQQERKGEVLEKTYVKVVPTVVLWDGVEATGSSQSADGNDKDEGDDDDVWDNMQEADSGEENTKGRKKSRAK